MVTAERLDTEVGQWAREMRTQNYHELHSHALVGMWSAFEAGVEDALAAVIEHDRVAGCAAASRVKTKRNPYPLEFWPWTSATCLGIAQKLDRCAMQATTRGGTDLFARIQTAFSWVEVSVDLDHTSSKVLAEASRTRNLTLHRHGKVTESDASDVPSLKPWNGAVMPIDGAKFTAYYLASHGIVKLFVIIGLWRKKLWYYPTAIVVFASFIVYQLYRFNFTHSIWLLVLTVLDVVVIWLTWHEYKYIKRTNSFS